MEVNPSANFFHRLFIHLLLQLQIRTEVNPSAKFFHSLCEEFKFFTYDQLLDTTEINAALENFASILMNNLEFGEIIGSETWRHTSLVDVPVFVIS